MGLDHGVKAWDEGMGLRYGSKLWVKGMGLDHGLVRGENCFLCLFFRDISLKNRSSSVYHLDRLPQGLCELCF